mmetsp:Transcript_29725/g.70606  ORF Transcript_29725/g.70606 Transcript_29725/m.70606 type:complete len:283 (-) Transcript_29725:493-1341(-)
MSTVAAGCTSAELPRRMTLCEAASSCPFKSTTRSYICPAQQPTALRTSTATGSVEASPPRPRSVWLRAHPATLTALRSTEHASSTRSPTLRPTSAARQCCHLRQSGSVPHTSSPGRKQGQPLVGRPPSRLRVAATSLTQQAEAAALRSWKWAPSSCLITARRISSRRTRCSSARKHARRFRSAGRARASTRPSWRRGCTASRTRAERSASPPLPPASHPGAGHMCTRATWRRALPCFGQRCQLSLLCRRRRWRGCSPASMSLMPRHARRRGCCKSCQAGVDR